MQDLKEHWNLTNSKYIGKKADGWEIPQDNWLDKHQKFFLKDNQTILELGCGMGITTAYLVNKGFDVIATDISEIALEYVNNTIKKAKTKQMNMLEPFPFKDNQFSIIIADLCLHYFDKQSTKKIMHEIKRILKPNGVLLARVNSKKDSTAGQGIKIEKNFYFVDGFNKRFFTKDDAQKMFKIIGKTTSAETDMTRHIQPKKTIEIVSLCEKN